MSLHQVVQDAVSDQQQDLEPLIDDAQRESAGALWSLASDMASARLINDAGAVPLLLNLVKTGSLGAQQTATGALNSLAALPAACKVISEADPIADFTVVLDKGDDVAKEQCSALMRRLANEFPENQIPIAKAMVAVLSSVEEDENNECATQLSYELSLDFGPRKAMAESGAIPVLVQQIELGSEMACEAATKALSELAKVSTDSYDEVKHELICARHAHTHGTKINLRVERAIHGMKAADDNDCIHEQGLGMSILFFRLNTRPSLQLEPAEANTRQKSKKPYFFVDPGYL